MVDTQRSPRRPQQSDPHADERARVLAAAAQWIGTPFVDCSSIRGAGVDCGMLIKSAYEEAGIESPFKIDRYSAQWYLNGDKELWLPLLIERGIEITQEQCKPADIVLYKFGSKFFSHGALIEAKGWPSIIHAYRQNGAVMRDLGDQGLLARCPRRFFTRKAWFVEAD